MKSQLTIYMPLYFWYLLYSITLYACLLPISQVLKSSNVNLLILFFSFKIILAFQGHLWFHTNFGTICSVKNAMGILTVIVLNMKITLGYMDILTMLILSLLWCIFPFISVQFLLYLCYSFQ